MKPEYVKHIIELGEVKETGLGVIEPVNNDRRELRQFVLDCRTAIVYLTNTILELESRLLELENRLNQK